MSIIPRGGPHGIEHTGVLEFHGDDEFDTLLTALTSQRTVGRQALYSTWTTTTHHIMSSGGLARYPEEDEDVASYEQSIRPVIATTQSLMIDRRLYYSGHPSGAKSLYFVLDSAQELVINALKGMRQTNPDETFLKPPSLGEPFAVRFTIKPQDRVRNFGAAMDQLRVALSKSAFSENPLHVTLHRFQEIRHQHSK